MGELLRGRLQSGKGDASHWLQLFNAAYSRKLQMPVYPGSLNLALEHTFDRFAVRYQAHIIWFGREEYGGERDVLLLPCELADFERRNTYHLQDGDVLAVELPVQDNAALTNR
jgi:CTP-dependent riboflavin kinase